MSSQNVYRDLTTATLTSHQEFSSSLSGPNNMDFTLSLGPQTSDSLLVCEHVSYRSYPHVSLEVTRSIKFNFSQEEGKEEGISKSSSQQCCLRSSGHNLVL